MYENIFNTVLLLKLYLDMHCKKNAKEYTIKKLLPFIEFLAGSFKGIVEAESG